ncbi:hypothetical protein LVJ85_07385 [Neisseria sp. Dent CA1/247]|uniref:hypothetical protein n=1 Tax=Neisseria sp. Dent CA1/247 TaxID=2912675 RepID=UPI001FD23748|nr:hypothetical protein [Neisseria sp. Dent CA1/247]UOO75878.1 hypothetical protein LVJ85_07385 [Neisseria sp. Dent CA1/247]
MPTYTTMFKKILIYLLTMTVGLLGACKPMQQEPQKDTLPETVSITLPESAQHFANRFTGYIDDESPGEPYSLTNYSATFASEKTVLFEHGVHSFRLPYVAIIKLYEDGKQQPFLGIDEFKIFAGLGKTSNISDEEARQNFYRLVKQMHQAGWRDLISTTAPRIKMNRKNAAAFFGMEEGYFRIKPITGIPTTIELTPDEWKQLSNLADIGTLYADGVVVSFVLGKDNDEQYRDKYGNGQYALVVTIEAHWNRVRLNAQEEFGKPTFNKAVKKKYQTYAMIRKLEEDKARAQGFEIDESYQDPPIPPLIELPRDGSR